jgi:D-amino-acid dehydrogenase
MHVVVIGGGVVGVTTAAALGRRGARVTLLESAPTLATGVTARNGAQLSYSYADPIGTPAILRDLPKLIAGFDPAFRIRADMSAQFVAWGLRLLANCSNKRFTANLHAVLRLALRSKEVLTELRGRHPDVQFDHAASGKVHIYDSAQKFEAAKLLVRIKNDLGCQQRALAREELLTLEPALSLYQRQIVGGIYSPIDEAGDAAIFTRALAGVSEREYRLSVLLQTSAAGFVMEGQRVRAVRTASGPVDADAFVLAAGCSSVELAASAGIKLPIYPMKGYSITLPATEDAPTVSVTDSRARVVFCRLRDELRIAGLAELGRANNDIEPHKIESLRQMARTCLPRAAEWGANPNSWSGLRPMTPDSRPIIGATPLANLFLNCGHGMLGWTLACGSADLLAHLMFDQQLSGDVRAIAADFSINRFSCRRTQIADHLEAHARESVAT